MTHALSSENGIVEKNENDDILKEISRLIAELQAHRDPAVREQVDALLEGIDAVHRTALSHLFTAIQGLGGEKFVSRLTADPAIRMLLMSYDLLAVDRRLIAEEALDAVRGHLHAHGIDVEILEVAGSEVFVKLYGVNESTMPIDAVRHDIETALSEGLIGFQALVIGERPQQKPGELIQLGGLKRAHRPVYRTVMDASELDPGGIRGVEVNGAPILIANIDGDLYAVANRCGDSPLPLEYSKLDGATLVCSWHACEYDLRSGARVDETGGERLRVYPVRLDAGQIQVAVGVDSSGPS